MSAVATPDDVRQLVIEAVLESSRTGAEETVLADRVEVREND